MNIKFTAYKSGGCRYFSYDSSTAFDFYVYFYSSNVLKNHIFLHHTLQHVRYDILTCEYIKT
jgi:hypothetical protein